MTTIETIRQGGLRPAAGVAVVVLFSLLAVPFVLLGWAIAVDSTGLDRTLPDVVYVVLLPAVTVAFVPTVVSRFVYDTGTGIRLGAIVVVVVSVVLLNSRGIGAGEFQLLTTFDTG